MLTGQKTHTTQTRFISHHCLNSLTLLTWVTWAVFTVGWGEDHRAKVNCPVVLSHQREWVNKWAKQRLVARRRRNPVDQESCRSIKPFVSSIVRCSQVTSLSAVIFLVLHRQVTTNEVKFVSDWTMRAAGRCEIRVAQLRCCGRLCSSSCLWAKWQK